MTRVTEIAPDQYSISIYVPEFNYRFNHFLIKHDEPLLLLDEEQGAIGQ